KINNMNVVTNTRPVWRLIISAVNFNIRSFAKRDLQHRGNQMRFRPMIFAEVLCGAGRVEVAQTNEHQPMYLVVPAKNFFESQFRFAVGTDRESWRGFVDWQAIRRTEDGAG